MVGVWLTYPATITELKYTMSSIALPQELVDQVIDHLYSDPQALSACALVCQSWVHPSRYHLFSSIVIRYRASPFFTLTSSPNCTIIPHIHEVQLLSHHPFIRRDLEWLVEALPHLTVLSSSPVADLKISRFNGEVLTAESCAVIPSIFPLLKRLNLYHPRKRWFVNLVEVFCMLPLLHSLRVEGASCFEEPLRHPARACCPLNSLRELDVIRGSVARHLLPWILTADDLSQLAKVTLWLGEGDFQAAGQFLTALGSSLEVLTLHYECDNEDEESMFARFERFQPLN